MGSHYDYNTIKNRSAFMGREEVGEDLYTPIENVCLVIQTLANCC